MLVQVRREGTLRLIAQHAHALVSGELACAWRGLAREPDPLPFQVVLAVGLHDLAWRGLDERPRLDPSAGRPYPFYAHPLTEKLAAYRAGLDELAAIHPYAALLGSLHYASFPDLGEAEEFQERERDRRRALRGRLGLEDEDEPRVQRDLAWLRLFDTASIFLCLTPPPSDPDANPAWVEDGRHLQAPGGRTFHLTWVDEEVVHADPFPFGDTLEVRIPCRDLPVHAFESQDALDRAWVAAPERHWWVTLRTAPRLA